MRNELCGKLHKEMFEEFLRAVDQENTAGLACYEKWAGQVGIGTFIGAVMYGRKPSKRLGQVDLLSCRAI